MSRIPASPLSKTVKRRRIIPAASAAAAAVSLAGCGMLGAPPAAHNPPPPSADQQEATRRVQTFTSDIDQALDNVDKERLRLAAEKQNQARIAATAPATEPAAASAVPATQPAAAATPAPSNAVASSAAAIPSATASGSASPRRPGQSPVILASTAGPADAEIPVSRSSSAPSAAPTPNPAAPIPAPTSPPAASAAPSAAAAGVAAPSGSNSVITPMAPVAAAPASAMSSMTAMLSNPQSAVPAASAALTWSSAASTPVADAVPQPTLQQALAVIRQNVDSHPTLATSLALALLDNQPPKDAPDPSAGLPEMDHKIFSDLLAAFESMKTQSAAAAANLAQRAAPLLDAGKKWQADADLELPRLVLASRVDSFGVFAPIDGKFEQGRQHTVIIYCEVANFDSKKGDDGWFTTELQQQETLMTDDGLLIWRPNPEDIEDRSMNQRHDFYMVKKLTIPENLAAGKYTLRMSVTDKNANKRALVSLPIEITAPK